MIAVAVIYAVVDLALALYIVASNVLVLGAFLLSRRVRTVTNTYIFSLATSDFFAGAIGIPLNVFAVLTNSPHTYGWCVSVHVVLRVLCAISTLHLLAIALDKYLSICCGRGVFERAGRAQRATLLLCTAWIAGAGATLLPLFWFGRGERAQTFNGKCRFADVIDERYLVFVLFGGTILLPSIAIVFCYVNIYSCIRNEERQVRCLLGGRERQRRLKGRRKLLGAMLSLVFTYAICWYPLYVMSTLNFFYPNGYNNNTLRLTAIILSHTSCAINPLIYAYGVPGFKQTLRSWVLWRRASDSMQRLSGHMKSRTSAILSDQLMWYSTTIAPKRLSKPFDAKTQRASSQRSSRKISAPPTTCARSSRINDSRGVPCYSCDCQWFCLFYFDSILP